MGCVSPGHAVRAVAILHRLPQTGRAVRRLGCGLPAVAHQPECTHQTRPARHGAAICSGRPSALRAHHHALLRCAHPAFSSACARFSARIRSAVAWRIYNWWSLFARLADPEHHREAITARPLLLSAIARKTQHAGQVTLTVSSMHGARDKARRVYVRIAGFLADLRKNAEQLDPLEKWYRILSEAFPPSLKGPQLSPPLRLNPG